jgi:nucleotide-binding universal stress UspA family protein
LALSHEFRTSQENRFRNKLDELVATVQGVETSYRVTIGPSVGLAIVEFAERYDFDVICIPAQGHGALYSVLFGSVAQSTVDASSVPVLVLPPRL